ncbi:MAG: hypothetical protein ABIP68_07185 [Ferruginibacter sp.]
MSYDENRISDQIDGGLMSEKEQWELEMGRIIMGEPINKNEINSPVLLSHHNLVEISYKWLIKRCGFAFKELRSLSSECPDVLGFRSCESILIECKISRSDFLSDKNKPFRKVSSNGMGNYRLYCCPKGLIKKEELPEKWGLIYVNEFGKATLVHNCFNNKGGNMYLEDNRFEANTKEEMYMLYAALRRLHIRGRIDEIYDMEI